MLSLVLRHREIQVQAGADEAGGHVGAGKDHGIAELLAQEQPFVDVRDADVESEPARDRTRRAEVAEAVFAEILGCLSRRRFRRSWICGCGCTAAKAQQTAK